jgi:trehalose utilization protein
MSDAPPNIKVLVWSERTEPEDVYPVGINGAIAEALNSTLDITAETACLADPNQGLADFALDHIDVLFWWGHQKHGDVTDKNTDRIAARVRDGGMGFVPIHSAHYAKPFKAVLDAECGLGSVRGDGKPEKITVVAPDHPIAKGVQDFVVPETEMFGEPFAVPEPDTVVFRSDFEGGEWFRSGCCWQVGAGRTFYFRPGHETFMIMQQDTILMILQNAARWAAGRT